MEARIEKVRTQIKNYSKYKTLTLIGKATDVQKWGPWSKNHSKCKTGDPECKSTWSTKVGALIEKVPSPGVEKYLE